jgi:hypothetical protein
MTIKNISDSAWNKILLGFISVLLITLVGLFVDGKHDLREDIRLLRVEMNDRVSVIDAKADNAKDVSTSAKASTDYLEKQFEDIKNELAKKR